MRFKNEQVLVDHTVKDDQAEAFGEWMVKEGHFDEEGSVLIRKAGEKYVLHVGIKPGVEQNADNEPTFRILADQLSTQVFHAPVDMHLCDRSLRTLVVLSQR